MSSKTAMASDHSTPPMDLGLNVRKRVCKACDRCRLKKSKCDGSTPCTRCKQDNAICVFGERKKTHDKVYPKGYVEMLEHQQTQLVNGLQELYTIATSEEGWEGPPLSDNGAGRPLTHDILSSLGVLRQDSQNSGGEFEEDLELIQQRLIRDGADMMQRRESLESDDGRPSKQLSFQPSGQQSMFTNPFAASQLPTPPMLSPADSHAAGTCLWQQPQPLPQPPPSHTSAHNRPQSLQIHPGHSSWEASMNPAILQSQNWAASPMCCDTTPDYLSGNGMPNFCSVELAQHQMALAAEGGIARWSEEDFGSFLNASLS